MVARTIKNRFFIFFLILTIIGCQTTYEDKNGISIEQKGYSYDEKEGIYNSYIDTTKIDFSKSALILIDLWNEPFLTKYIKKKT